MFIKVREGSITVLESPAYRNRSGNPYNAMLSDSLRAAGLHVREFSIRDMLLFTGDIWHIHWPEHCLHRRSPALALLSMLRFIMKLCVARMTRTKIVWTVHNLESHDTRYPLLGRALRRIVVAMIDGWISLSWEAQDAARDAFPPLVRKPSLITPHGHYRSEFPSSETRGQSRKELDIPQHCAVILFFGQIRAYKNPLELIRAFRTLQGSDYRLLIAGKAGTANESALIRRATAGDPRIRAELRFIPNEDMLKYFAASDITVLPYGKLLNSGAALLSLSFNTPILAPNVGSILSLSRMVGSPWVNMYEGKLDQAKLADSLNLARQAVGTAPLGAFDWSAIGEDTATFFYHVARDRHLPS